MAVLLEVARLLAGKRLPRTVQFVAFTLEERQSRSFSILRGSKEFVRSARERGRRYAVALILECVGFTDPLPRRQIIPPLVKVAVPDTADFLAVIADRRSRQAMERFCRAAAAYVPGLSTAPYAVPYSGYLLPQIRWSDHASFWDAGYPALMLTDTAMFRNPHYHTSHDRHETLDYGFIAGVARAVVAALATYDAFSPGQSARAHCRTLR
jgi:Zn-dependent M28 family amino/carboxypeptidase